MNSNEPTVSNYTCIVKFRSCLAAKTRPYTVILLPAHPASFAHKFLFQRVPASPGMQQ